jgi:hypothetical protein
MIGTIDWAAAAPAATAAGTLVLAVATVSAVRSGQQPPGVTEMALLAGMGPVLLPSCFAELPRFRAIRHKCAVAVPNDEDFLSALNKGGRVLLAFTPDQPVESWTAWGLD